MEVSEIIHVSGFVTREMSIKGKSLPEIEKILGFHTGRLNNGLAVAILLEIPGCDQFTLAGYTQVADHKFNKDKALKGLDEKRLKEMAAATFTTTGLNRLVKVLPVNTHNNSMAADEQYPPGYGVPQWKLTQALRAQVVAKVRQGERYK